MSLFCLKKPPHSIPAVCHFAAGKVVCPLATGRSDSTRFPIWCPFATGAHDPALFPSCSSLSCWKKGSNSIPIVCCFAARQVDCPLATEKDDSTIFQVVCPLATGNKRPSSNSRWCAFFFTGRNDPTLLLVVGIVATPKVVWPAVTFRRRFNSYQVYSLGVTRPPAAISSRLPPRATAPVFDSTEINAVPRRRK